MSNNKKASNPSSTITHSFTETLFFAYAILFFTVGISLVFFTSHVSLIAFGGDHEKISNIFLQMLGSFELLVGFLIFGIRKLEARVIYYSVSGLILAGFINFYLLLSLNDYIILPSVYFIFQIIIQLSFFVVLFEQLKRK